jgi:hypothetical protein
MPRVVTPSVLAPRVVTPATSTPDDGRPLTSAVAFLAPDVDVFPLDLFHLRRGLVGSTASRQYFGFRWGGTNYGCDTTHQGSGADCTVWNASMAGRTRINVALASGARTGTEWATAIAAALVAAGVTTATSVGPTVIIPGASALTWPGNYDESLRGMQGRRRHRFATGTPAYTGVNARVAVHVPAPAAASRLLCTYILDTTDTRVGSIRLALADGPTYSIANKAMTNSISAVATAGSNDLYAIVHANPVAATAAQDKWVVYKTNTAADYQIGIRNHGSSPVGNGDLVVGESIIIDLTSTNPAVDDGASYTVTASTSATVYAAVGYVYEQPNASGDYYGDASISTWVGFRLAYDVGTPTTINAATLATINDTPRFPVPWTNVRITSSRSAAGNNAADEDFGRGAYDMSDVTLSSYPLDQPAPLLRAIEPMGASAGAGYKVKTWSPPIDLTGVTRVGMFLCAGNVDGVTPPDTISVLADAITSTTAWVDQRDWDDSTDVGGYGTDMQYVGASGTTDMPVGDPSPAVSPDPYDTDATDTNLNNVPRAAELMERTGFAIAA